MVRCHEAPVSLSIMPYGSCWCTQLTCSQCCRGVDLNHHLVVCLRRRPLFGDEVSPSSFATMMAGKAALPWEGTHAPALSCIDNADARLLISGLLRSGTSILRSDSNNVWLACLQMASQLLITRSTGKKRRALQPRPH